jgi:capsule polysaccharide modification protein KpsS
VTLPSHMINMGRNISVQKTNNYFIVTIHFLNDLQTFAYSEPAIDVAVEEAILCFIKAAKECGKELCKELNY